MKELVFLLEEESARAMLTTLLPRLLPDDWASRLIAFEGKQDLHKQLIRKIRGYQNPEARFIVLRDQDSHPDCKALKNELLALCDETGRRAQCLVRLACRELEAFYLGDLAAVERALKLDGLARQQGQRRLREPDRLESPSQELRKLTRQRYEKVAGSRALGRELDLNNTRSASFSHLIGGIRRLTQ